ncbi:F0F1 ATP synthase subunit epsilon [Desulfosarcina sp.]|uniref:F0F1 ATP synthase subunit epsilon n=1 Tax=Desulfosarcina sp. TaxID=2027861 RepID=UPI00356A494A
MAESIRLEVVTPEKSVVSESAQIVMAPGSMGEFGVLSGHTPFLTTLKTGALKYKDESGRERFVFVSSGFAEALPDRVTVLAESAERRKDIDIQRAQSAVERAEKRLQSGGKDVDYIRAKAALLRAISRIQLAQTR